MNLKEILARIEMRLKATGLSADRASNLAGKKDAIRNMRRAVKGEVLRHGVSNTTIEALAPVLGTTAAWLLHEEGAQESTDGQRSGKLVFVPEISWVSAGYLADTGQATPTSEVPLLAFTDLGRGDFFALRVKGDSMDRISPEGSVIIVNRADTKLVRGKPYIFQVAGEASYKMWETSDGIDRLEPYSFNPSNKTIFVKKNKEFSVIGRVRRTMFDL